MQTGLYSKRDQLVYKVYLEYQHLSDVIISTWKCEQFDWLERSAYFLYILRQDVKYRNKILLSSFYKYLFLQ